MNNEDYKKILIDLLNAIDFIEQYSEERISQEKILDLCENPILIAQPSPGKCLVFEVEDGKLVLKEIPPK